MRKSEKSPETEKLAESPRVLMKQVIIETPSVQKVSELISSKSPEVIISSKVMAPTVKAKSPQITTKHIEKELVKPLVLEAPKVPKLSIASFPRIPKINKNPKVGPLILGIRDPRLEKRMLAEKIPTPAPEIVIPEIIIPEIVIPEIASESSSDSESDSLEGSDSSDSSNRQVKSDCSVDHENKVKETKPEAEESKVDPPKDDIEKLETSDLESDHENYDDDFVELNASDG